jgi:hypothetical protein
MVAGAGAQGAVKTGAECEILCYTLMTPLQKGHFLRRYRHMHGFGYCKSTICGGCLLKS